MARSVVFWRRNTPPDSKSPFTHLQRWSMRANAARIPLIVSLVFPSIAVFAQPPQVASPALPATPTPTTSQSRSQSLSVARCSYYQLPTPQTQHSKPSQSNSLSFFFVAFGCDNEFSSWHHLSSPPRSLSRLLLCSWPGFLCLGYFCVSERILIVGLKL